MAQPQTAYRRGSVSQSDRDPDAPAEEAPGTPLSNATQGQILDLYKLAVEMADRVSSRRTSANSFFLALHAALASVVSFLGLAPVSIGSSGGAEPADNLGLVLIALAGVVLSISWFLILRSYRDLNTAKFKVINSIEAQLPLKPFSEEWRYLKEDAVKGWRGRYREQGSVERVVPILFSLLYILAGAHGFVG
jgi:hypothetical protein